MRRGTRENTRDFNMHWKSFPKTAMSACAAALVVSTAASAQSVSFTDSIPLSTTNWTDSVSVSRFDPDLGDLISVDFELEAFTQGSAMFESQDAQPATVTLNFQVSIALQRPDMSTLVTSSPAVMTIDNATAFDGTIDFGGTSGVTHPNLVANQVETATSPPPASDLVLFTGAAGNPGMITLPVVAMGQSSGTGAGNLLLQFSSMAGANVTVTYNYAADCNDNDVPDDEDISNGTSEDCNNNGVPDECEPDCNMNGVADECEPDCNNNGVIDDCDRVPCEELDCKSIDRRRAGSLLLFPEFDNREAVVSILTVTNTNCTFTGNPFTENVAVEYVYIDGDDCSEFNLTTTLTPCDTLTVVTNYHNPEDEQGYVYVFAKSVTTGEPIVHNHLIGQTLIVNGYDSFEYATNAVSFRGVGDGTFTDLDSDGIRDLDGVEYEEAPEEILIPRFLGQDDELGNNESSSSRSLRSWLVLVNLTGGAAFTTTIDFLIYNDNEEVFSSEHTFECWTKEYLLDISGIFGNQFLKLGTNENPLEILGAPYLESGWFKMDGAVAQSTSVAIEDPAFYGVLVEKIGNYAVADLPFELCHQTNGDLLPRSILGDN